MPMLLNSPVANRTQGYIDSRLLKVALQNNVLGRWGDTRIIPPHQTMTLLMRRFEKMPAQVIKQVQEFITPSSSVLTYSDYVMNLMKIGDWIENSEEAEISHQDPLHQIETERLGQQADEMIDFTRASVLSAGTNVFYANGASRSAVNTTISAPNGTTAGTAAACAFVKLARRSLMTNLADKINSMIVASTKIDTHPIPETYIAVCHSDVLNDLERFDDGVRKWYPPENYASVGTMLPKELGQFAHFRYIEDNNLTPYLSAGGAASTYGVKTTDGVHADVYPILIFGKHAYATGSLGGQGSIKMHIVDATKPAPGNPLGQRGSIGWTSKMGTIITEDFWMARLEVAVSA